MREDGTDPEFDHTGTRLYFRDRRDNKTVLASVTLGNADEIVHARSDNATQIVPSPDGRWLAFTERWRAYVAPFPQTGRPVDLAPKGTAFPIAQVSRDSGWSLHWSDARHVHWTLGPDLFTRDLTHTFPFIEQGREKPDEPESQGVPIGFTMASDKPAGRVALVGARIITMAGRADATSVIENGTILVDANRIVDVGAADAVVVPADAKRVDVRGRQSSRASSTSMRTSAASRAAFSRRRAGRSRQTSPTASPRRTIRRTTPRPSSPTAR